MLTFLFSPHEWDDCKMAHVPVLAAAVSGH